MVAIEFSCCATSGVQVKTLTRKKKISKNIRCQQHEGAFYSSVKPGHIVSIQMSKYARGNLERWDKFLGVSHEQKQILLHIFQEETPTFMAYTLSLYIETRVCTENRHFS